MPAKIKTTKIDKEQAAKQVAERLSIEVNETVNSLLSKLIKSIENNSASVDKLVKSQSILTKAFNANSVKSQKPAKETSIPTALPLPNDAKIQNVEAQQTNSSIENTSSASTDEQKDPSFIQKDNVIDVNVIGITDKSAETLGKFLPESLAKRFEPWFKKLMEPKKEEKARKTDDDKGIFSSFPGLATIGKAMATIGLIGGVLTLLAGVQTEGPLKGLTKIIGGGLLKMALPKFLAMFGKTLTKIPIIGTIISLGYAFSRFQSGDVVGGFIDVLSGIASLVPGPGTFIAFGLDALNAVLDMQAGGSGKEAGAKKEKPAAGWLGKLLKWILIPLKKIPFIGLLMGVGSAYLRFKQGQILRGGLEIISGIATLFPGIGTAISFGIDALTTLLDATEGGEGDNTQKEQKQQQGGGVWQTFKKWAWYAFTKLPIVGFITGIGKAWNRIKQGQILKGTLELLSGIATTFPGIGTVISIGIDGLLAFLDSKEENQAQQSSQTQTPKENPFEAIKKAIVEKAQKWWKNTWDWVKWLARKILPDNIIKFLDNDQQPKETDLSKTTEKAPATKQDSVVSSSSANEYPSVSPQAREEQIKYVEDYNKQKESNPEYQKTKESMGKHVADRRYEKKHPKTLPHQEITNNNSSTDEPPAKPKPFEQKLSEYSDEELSDLEKKIESRLDKSSNLSPEKLEKYLNVYESIGKEQNKRSDKKAQELIKKTKESIQPVTQATGEPVKPATQPVPQVTTDAVKSIDSMDSLSRAAAISRYPEIKKDELPKDKKMMSDDKFEYIKNLNFIQRGVLFTFENKIKTEYEERLKSELENKKLKPEEQATALPTTTKQIEAEKQKIPQPDKQLPEWNKKTIQETAPEAKKEIEQISKPKAQQAPHLQTPVDKQVEELKKSAKTTMDTFEVGEKMEKAWMSGSLNENTKEELRSQIKTLYGITNPNEFNSKLSSLSEKLPFNFKILEVETKDAGYHKPLKKNENPAAVAESEKPKPKVDEEKIKQFSSLVSERKITEAQRLIDETISKKDFNTSREMITVWKDTINNRSIQDSKDGTLKNFTSNISEEYGPLKETVAKVHDAEYKERFLPEFKEKRKKLDESLSKFKLQTESLKATQPDKSITPSAPKSDDSSISFNNSETTNASANASLLQSIANNTGNSNTNMSAFANGFNQMAKALERVGEAVGEKVKIPPVVVNNSTGGGQQKQVSSTEIAKQGNPAIAQFRAMMENYRPIPA
jgi:hypothetical protein